MDVVGCQRKLYFEARTRASILLLILALICLMPCQSKAQGSLPIDWMYGPIGQPLSVAYSPDGSLIAVGGSDWGGLQVLSAATGKFIAYFPTTANSLASVSFSPDGKLLADGGWEVLELWNVSTGELVASLPTTAYSQAAVAFSPDGKTLADCGSGYGGEGVLELWNVASAKLITAIDMPQVSLSSVAFSPDGTMLADAGSHVTGLLEVRNPATGKLGNTLNTAVSYVDSIAFSPDSALLADGGDIVTYPPYQVNGTLELWNLSKGALSSSFPTPTTTVDSVAFSPDGKSLADGAFTNDGSDCLELWDVSTAKLLTKFGNSIQGGVFSVAFSPDGTALAASNSAFNGGVDLFAVPSGLLISTLNTTIFYQTVSTAISPDHKSVVNGGFTYGASANMTGWLGLWDAESGTIVRSFNTAAINGVRSVAISPDGQVLADGGIGVARGVVELWNLASGSLIGSLNTSATEYVASVAFSPDGTILADGGYDNDGVVELWNLTTGTLMATLDTNATGGVTSVAFSPDGKTLAVCGDSGVFEAQFGVLELWSVSAGTRLRTLNTSEYSPESVVFSADGRFFANGGRVFIASGNSVVGEIELWDAGNDVLLASLPGDGDVPSVSFSPDGKTLFAGTGGGLEVFDTTNFSLQSDYPVSSLSAVAVSPDNSLLALCTTNSKLIVANNPYNIVNLVGGITLSPSSVIGGSATIGTITLSQAAPTGGIEVSLTLNSGFATIPGTVMIAGGATTATFRVITAPVNGSTEVTILATTGSGAKSAILTISPAQLISMSLDPTSVAGGSSVAGTVTLNGPAGPGGVFVLASSSNNAASVIDTFTIEAGQNTGKFTVSTSPVSDQEGADITTSLNGKSQTIPLWITPATLTSISLGPPQVSGGNPSVGTITLIGVAGPGGYPVTLSSSNSCAIVPSTVTVAAGQSAATFAVKTTAVSSTKVVTITAKSGEANATATLTIAPPVLASISVVPIAVTGGTESTGTATLSGPAETGGVVVTLASNAKQATTPPSVKIEAGKASTTFIVRTVPVSSEVVAKITGSLNDNSQIATIEINSPVIEKLSVSPTSLTGGASSMGAIQLSGPAPKGGLTVGLGSNVLSAQVPATVTVLDGRVTATFSVKTLSVSNSLTATVSATLGGVTQKAALKINAPVLTSITVRPSTVQGGKACTGTVAINSAAPSVGLTITLTSSALAATVPQTVTIPAGKISAEFVVNTSSEKASTQSTITATLGAVSKTATLTIL